jgi:hypothetical protein
MRSEGADPDTLCERASSGEELARRCRHRGGRLSSRPRPGSPVSWRGVPEFVGVTLDLSVDTLLDGD